MNETKPRQFRLDDDVLLLLDRLRAKLGGLTRTSALKIAIKRLAEQELGEREKKSKKSAKLG